MIDDCYYTCNALKLVYAQGKYMRIKVYIKDLLTILGANGHPTPDHYGNRRSGIPHRGATHKSCSSLQRLSPISDDVIF